MDFQLRAAKQHAMHVIRVRIENAGVGECIRNRGDGGAESTANVVAPSVCLLENMGVIADAAIFFHKLEVGECLKPPDRRLRIKAG